MGHSGPPIMRLQAALATDVGRTRSLNEDFGLVDAELGLHVVCDGMGGHAAGEIASRTAASVVQQVVRARHSTLAAIAGGTLPIDEAALLLREAVTAASHAIHEMGRADISKKGMGTTLVALLVCGTKGVMANVGDSRLYLRRHDHIHQLSEDHTFLQEAVRAGMLTPEQARQSEHTNIVTRAVGPLDRVVVDTLFFDLLEGDTLLLCSDGLHGYLGEDAELSSWLGADDVEQIPAQLVAVANARGGADNITALAVRVSRSLDARDRESGRSEQVTRTFATLHHIELFSEFTLAELVKVANVSRTLELGPEQVVVLEGEVSEGLFVVQTGRVEVSRGQQAIAWLGPGAHFGEMALLSQRPRSATVRTREATRLLLIERPDLHELMRVEPVMAGKFLWKLAQTLSLRLDDAYAVAPAPVSMSPRPTVPFGLHASPFQPTHE